MGRIRRLAQRAFLALPESVQPLARYYLSGRSRRILRVTKGDVASGPFKGMCYVHRSLGSNYCPKLLGTYEMELWPVIERAIARNHRTVIDIGAAEGYYAVGFARRLPAAWVVCFEAAVHEHHLLRKLARLNGVQGRIEMRGFCTPLLLNDALELGPSPLIICDIDGGEYELLDPQAVPMLRHTDMLVELHDFLRPGASEVLRERFTPTHAIEVIAGRERTPGDWPLASQGGWQEEAACMAEGRPALQDWLYLQAKNWEA